MKKRGFLAPLAVSVAALLGSANAASASITVQPELELAIEAAKSQQAPGLVIERSQASAPELAWHTSHQSHASHQSHESHSSHYSGW